MYFERLKQFIFSSLVFVVITGNAHAASGDLLSVNYTVFIQIVIFLIAIFILNKLVFKPFLGLVDRRDKLTRGAIEEAHELEDKVKAIKEKKDNPLDEGALDNQIASLEKVVAQKKKETADAEKKVADMKAKEASAEAQG